MKNKKKSQNFKKIIFASLWMLSCSVFAQKITVSGIVTDVNNEPVIGASVRELGNISNGTLTDVNGGYTLNNVSSNASLEASFVGLITQKVDVNGRNVVNIIMEEDTKLLDEVVVVGYGTQKKASITGSVATITSEKLTVAPTASTSNLLGRTTFGFDC